MKTCQSCQRDFPDHLINELARGGARGLTYTPVCPPCGLRMMNEHCGENRTNFTPGTRAQALLEQARVWLGEKQCKSN